MPLLRRRQPGDDLMPGYLDQAHQNWLRDCASMGEHRVDGYQLSDEYYDGKQRTELTDRAAEYLEPTRVKFCENFCEVVVDVMAERLRVLSFHVPDLEQLAAWLNDTVWARNRMDEVQGVVHTETTKLGDGFLLVDWDERRKIPRLKWNNPRRIKPVYDDDGGDMLYATKIWSTDRRGPFNPDGLDVMRLNVYRPDRVEKWFSFSHGEGSVWQPWQDTPGEPWPVPWTESGELPVDPFMVAEDALGVPVIHFRNKPKGRRFGRSEIPAAIPFQDEINKQVLDLFMVMDAQGWQWPWVGGVPENTDVSLAIGDLLVLHGENAKAGILPAADPQPLLKAIEATLNRMAARTGTPLFELTPGVQVSGESRKVQEARLVHKCEDRQVTHGNSWEDAMGLAWHLADVFGDGDVPAFGPGVEIQAVWDSPETRDELAEATTYEAYERLGVSKKTIVAKLGFDPDSEADQRQEESQAALDAAQAAFDRGNVQ